ncbi:MAG: hypothetical protein A2498_13795 [Lentisphaerae bacterium RIFOXYC12_FULL_60_16]|nr:MAG: hypothetical protein A2498_13795 [Lentisphaerae bacterium RIFOXYC12_FULL_60_16]
MAMKIIQVSASDGEGGAARAAYRLHAGLLQAGYDSRMMVRHRVTGDPAVHTFATGWSVVQRIRGMLRAKRIELAMRRFYRKRPGGLGPFTDDRSRFGAAIGTGLPKADVVNLHWVGNDYFDYGGFFSRYPACAPVVWTLHDMNVLTGGCHYNEGCDRYLDGCGCCPQLGSADPNDLSHGIFNRKQAVFNRMAATGRFRVVSCSQWLGRLARQSKLVGRFPVSVIPNGIDPELYQPRPAQDVRHALGIGNSEKMILFVAEQLAARRKGMPVLLEAMCGVCRVVPGVRLVCVGALRQLPEKPDVPLINLGTIQDDRLLSLIYSAADLFVIPSLQENFPLTVLESMACGTPVAGFDTGGIPEMVRPGRTGLLAPVGDAAALTEAIIQILKSDALRRDMAVACRATVLAEYTLAQQVEAYAALYRDMTGRRDRGEVAPAPAVNGINRNG